MSMILVAAALCKSLILPRPAVHFWRIILCAAHMRKHLDIESSAATFYDLTEEEMHAVRATADLSKLFVSRCSIDKSPSF